MRIGEIMTKSKKTVGINVLIIILIIIFVLSLIMIVRHYILDYKYRSDFEKISFLAPLPSSQHTQNSEQMQNDEDFTPEEFYLYLKYQNEHTRAYMTIPDTNVAYPVMYWFENPEYYLRRDFNKKYSRYGTPFYETRCADDGNARIIYGHHISGNKMFGELLNYRDIDYLKAHNTLYMFNENGEQSYRIIASLYTAGNDPDQIFWRAIDGVYTDEEYSAYLKDIKSKSAAYDDSFTPESLSQILVLSTCEYSREDGRFLVIAVKQD